MHMMIPNVARSLSARTHHARAPLRNVVRLFTKSSQDWTEDRSTVLGPRTALTPPADQFDQITTEFLIQCSNEANNPESQSLVQAASRTKRLPGLLQMIVDDAVKTPAHVEEQNSANPGIALYGAAIGCGIAGLFPMNSVLELWIPASLSIYSFQMAYNWHQDCDNQYTLERVSEEVNAFTLQVDELIFKEGKPKLSASQRSQLVTLCETSRWLSQKVEMIACTEIKHNRWAVVGHAGVVSGTMIGASTAVYGLKVAPILGLLGMVASHPWVRPWVAATFLAAVVVTPVP